MTSFRGRVVGRVGAWAVTQCEVGLLPIPDASGRLAPGDGVLLDVAPLDEGRGCEDDDAPCVAFCVERGAGGLALLRRPGDPCAPPVPVVLADAWPALVVVRAYSPSPEVAEGAEGVDPENFNPTTRPR